MFCTQSFNEFHIHLLIAIVGQDTKNGLAPAEEKSNFFTHKSEISILNDLHTWPSQDKPYMHLHQKLKILCPRMHQNYTFPKFES